MHKCRTLRGIAAPVYLRMVRDSGPAPGQGLKCQPRCHDLGGGGGNPEGGTGGAGLEGSAPTGSEGWNAGGLAGKDPLGEEG